MIQIDELVLRVPGMSNDEGRRLGQEVAERVSAQLPESSSDQRIGELTIRLTTSPGASRSQLAEAIAEQILQQLKLTTL